MIPTIGNFTFEIGIVTVVENTFSEKIAMIYKNPIIFNKMRGSDSKEKFYYKKHYFKVFFLLAGHKMDFIAPCGANKSTF